jgi:hypothetical protein
MHPSRDQQPSNFRVNKASPLFPDSRSFNDSFAVEVFKGKVRERKKCFTVMWLESYYRQHSNWSVGIACQSA